MEDKKEKAILLEMEGITKSFPGVKALDNVSFTLERGTVHALMGENGAGKSTLMKILFGIYHEDEGSIKIDGVKTQFANPKQAMDHGVSMVHQELNQVLKRDVADNILLGRFPKRGPLINQSEMYRYTKEVMDRLGLDIDPRAKVNTLSVAQRQMVEIAKAVSYDSKILVLDEPTSSLTEQEVEVLFGIIERLKENGVGIIYISHKMDEILRISDYITILRDGQYVATARSEDMTNDKIIALMVGRSLDHVYPPKTNTPGETLLEVKNLTGKYMPTVKEATFTLRKGEILGVSGLVGARRTELLETLFGIRTVDSGEIYVHGKKVENNNSHDGIKNGFALVTEERRATGIFPVANITFNSTIANMRKYKKIAGLLSDGLMKEDSEKVVKSLRVKTPNLKTHISSLSGGNQQKVIFGRWLLTQPEILLLDEPTRGIDVGAKYEIYQLIINLANEGKGVIVVSSEMPELFGICDRIMVMSNGRIAGIDDVENLDQEKVMTLATEYL